MHLVIKEDHGLHAHKLPDPAIPPGDPSAPFSTPSPASASMNPPPNEASPPPESRVIIWTSHEKIILHARGLQKAALFSSEPLFLEEEHLVSR